MSSVQLFVLCNGYKVWDIYPLTKIVFMARKISILTYVLAQITNCLCTTTVGFSELSSLVCVLWGDVGGEGEAEISTYIANVYFPS